MLKTEYFVVSLTSMVDYNNCQRAEVNCCMNQDAHVYINVFDNNTKVVEKVPLSVMSGAYSTYIMLPCQDRDFDAIMQLVDVDGNTISEYRTKWEKPREWQFYVMISSHTDIGLHNSQYIQRYNSERFIDKAMKLCDETDDRSENDQYRYVIEGSWFWNNYPDDRGKEAAEKVVNNYIKKGKIGVCAGIAGNCIQQYGLEEMCRTSYTRNKLKNDWNIDCKTMTMIDNPGLTWSMIQPYTDAGYENIIFAPNQWNPWPSTVWHCDTDTPAFIWSTQAAGGGNRMDFRYGSKLPMVFYWQASDKKSKMLVLGSTQYEHGGSFFGLSPFMNDDVTSMTIIENSMAKRLSVLEKSVPYNVWLLCCYADDQEPNIGLTNAITEWNRRWKWPKIRTLGNPDEPFNLLRERFDKQIPVLSGDITGGWYQMSGTAPELLSQKYRADYLLPTAEKWATIAALLDKNYKYPAVEFSRAWDMMSYNDEHSYGCSGYQGQRVFETWMQHRDWLNKISDTAENQVNNAISAIAGNISSDSESVVFFNSTLQQRTELIETENGEYTVSDIPAMGYKVVAKNSANTEKETLDYDKPPVIDNKFYRIKFNTRGSVSSILDKELNRELLDVDNTFGCNEFVYTQDNHKSFVTPQKASFTVIKTAGKTVVRTQMSESNSGAEIVQILTLLNNEKRIDIENRLQHVKSLYNNKRYYKYCYYAFPFMVKDSRRLCHLNGCIAEYGKDVTGHGTDVYMAANEWSCSENKDYGVALLQADTQLVEFDHIHPDKTDYGRVGNGSQIYSFIANDWLQMHSVGGNDMNFIVRYSILSYKGNHRESEIGKVSERFTNPVIAYNISMQSGTLEKSGSFMSINDTNMRLVALKRAEDGHGIIARFYTGGANLPSNLNIDLPICMKTTIQRNTVDEREADKTDDIMNGFITYRINRDTVNIFTRENSESVDNSQTPLPIGTHYTGLITNPCAARGEDSGQLYLLWGANTERDLKYYELYRSEKQGFKPSAENLVSHVDPDKYRVAGYIDTGLKSHCKYFYRVRALNKQGNPGEFSNEFYGMTKEEIL